jgi:eukaryotic-like serine/threonine-protein kinase
MALTPSPSPNARTDACLDPETARGFALAQLSDEVTARVETHIDGCSECRCLVSELARSNDSHVSEAATLLAETPGPRGAAPVHAQGDRIGRYVLDSVLGRGGMGVVYAARDPELDRPVAVKVLRPELWSSENAEQARTRLLREAQAMARVAHPNVVTVHDVGTAGAELYVAMELVDGTSLRTWLRSEPRPKPAAIIAAFVQAGRGLAQAHAAGLVHRDFKPDNVLRGKDGRICVTDFGLARSLSVVETDDSIDSVSVLDARMTQSGSLMGTPLYMAPEQLNGLDVDTRTDQFSFCVALYEALYEQHPFGGGTIAELADQVLAGRIRPPPPRTRVPERIRRILARGMAVKAEDRFPSIDVLLAALVRDPGRTWRRGIAATALAGGAIAGWLAFGFKGTPDMCQGADRAWDNVFGETQRVLARKAVLATNLPYAKTVWDSVERSLGAYRRQWVEMRIDACEATRVRGEQSEALLDRRMECLNRRLGDVTAVTALFIAADAQVVEKSRSLVDGLAPVAGCGDAASLEAAVDPPHPGQLASVTTIRTALANAKALAAAGKLKEAMEAARPTADAARAVGYRPVEAEALFRIGTMQELLGDPKSAEKTLYDALWAAEASRSDELAAEVWTSLVSLVGGRQGRVEEGERVAQRASAALERVGHPAPLEILLLESTATLRMKQANNADALAILDKALQLAKQVYGDEDARTARIDSTIATVLMNLEKFDDARARYERVKLVQTKLLGPDHPDLASTLEHEATIGVMTGQFDRALADYKQALAIAERSLGKAHPQIAIILGGMGQAYFAQEKYAEALPYLERAATTAEQSLGPDNPTTARHLGNYGLALAGVGKRDEALAVQQRALAIKERNLGPNHPAVAATLTNIGELLQRSERYTEALASHQRAVAIYTAKYGNKPNAAMAMALANSGRTLVALGRFSEALPLLEQALPVLEANKSQPPEDVAKLKAAVTRAKTCSRSPAGPSCRASKAP